MNQDNSQFFKKIEIKRYGYKIEGLLMEDNHRNSLREYLIISLIIITYLTIIRLVTPLNTPPDPYYSTRNDHTHYIEMAEDFLRIFRGESKAPYCYRILMPFIAWILPIDLIISFHTMTILALFFTGILLYDILKNNFNKKLAFVGITLFYSLNNVAPLLLYNFWLTDAVAHFFLILCFWAILNSNHKIYAISLCLGILAKEIVLFTILVLVLFEFINTEKKNRIKKMLKLKYFLIILPAISLFFTIHLLIPSAPTRNTDYFQLLQFHFNEKLENFSDFIELTRFIFALTFGTWGVLILFLPLFNEKEEWIEWFKIYGIFMVLIYCQILIATGINRLIVAGFFPMILLSLSGLQNLIRKKKFNENFFVYLSIFYFISYLFVIPLFNQFLDQLIEIIF